MNLRGPLLLAVAALWTAGAAAKPIPPECFTDGFAVGCQAWSFNRYTAFEAIAKTAEAGGRTIEFYPGQPYSPAERELKLDHHLPAAALARLREELQRRGVVAVNYGVVWLGGDEKEDRAVFEFARTLGLYAVTSEPDPASLDLIERLVKEYDVRLAIHNHPKRADDPAYRNWDPRYVLSLVKDRDRRLGSCADTGHWLRSGIKPADALRILRGRITSAHLKDLNVFSPDGHDVPYGLGVADVPGLLAELRRQKFAGNLSIEYEYHEDASVPEIAQCIGFVRGFASAAGR